MGLIAIIGLGMAIAGNAAIADAGVREYQACRNGRADPDTRIFACSRILADAAQPKHIVAEMFRHRANAYFSKKNCDGAIPDFSYAILLNNKEHDSYFKRGICFYDMKDFLPAISDAADAIRINTEDDHRYYNLRGYAHKDYGNRDEAIKDLRRSLKIAPGNETALKGLQQLGVGP